MARIVVTGGRGTLGRAVVATLRAAAHSPAVMTWRTVSDYGPEVAGNLATGENLVSALRGAEVVIHCATDFMDHTRVDGQGTKNLLASVDKKTIKHLIYPSILGIDDSDVPYYQSKKTAEEMLSKSDFPYSILRFAQFHDFVLSFIQRFVYDESESLDLPAGLSFQSIATADVAQKLAAHLDLPQPKIQEFAGPQVLTLDDMVAELKSYRYQKYSVNFSTMHNPLYTAFMKGKNLSSSAQTAGLTWKQFLSEQFERASSGQGKENP